MSDIAGRIAALTPEKRALLAARLARSECPLPTVRQQLPLPEQSIVAPLSYSQRSVWFLDQLYPGNAAYNSPIAVRFTGRLDLTALEWSLNQVVRRHDLLRTVFEPRDGDPVQRAYPFRPLQLRKMEFTHLAELVHMEAARMEAVRIAQEPFDLANALPWRAKLLCYSEREHILVLILHHIICDGWSIGVLMRELMGGYEAFLRGEACPFSELPFQYSHYVLWQQQQLAGPAFQNQVENWRKHLEGVTGAIQIPLDKPRPVEPTFRGGRVSVLVPAQLTQSLRGIAHSERATLFMVLLGAFKVLLSRYSSQSDIIVGSPIANRERREFEGLIGFFANTLALRTDLSGDPTFVELLARVREITIRAYDCQEVPFEKLVEELKPERQLNRNPFFDISFSFQNLPMPEINVPDLSIDLLRVDNGTSKFDLSVVIVETQRGLATTVEYSSDLFDALTATRVLENYRSLLEGIAEDPRRKISRFPLLTESEWNRIVVEWNATEVPYPRDRCIHHLFGEQVKRSPQAIAVVFGGEKLTYSELELRSSRLARYLTSLGVGLGARVAISMEPSVEMIVGLLGILKAGAAYVPIDPDYPEERICFMLGDTAAEVLLTQERLLGGLSGSAVKKICLDADWEPIGRVDEVWQESRPAEGSDVAYVMYTSGSTGTPKGVCVSHRAVSRLVINSGYVQLSSEDVIAQISNCCFDAATFEIWGALLNGSRLVGIERESVLSSERFSAELARHGVTTLFVTTALFNELAHGRAQIFCGLRNVLFGGEECDPGAVRRVMESGSPPERLLHCYGPTETTTFATRYEVRAGQNWEGKIPIGRPISNTQVYILDGHFNPVPVGAAGEICIGGDGVAHGYLNRPDLTAERFISSPFARDQRLYRTGDLGRFLPDGNIEFLGRRDEQVKIRGFRIELGEIEGALVRHDAVRQAVVCMRESGGGAGKDKRLVAYVVVTIGHHTAKIGEELGAFLKQKLPDYMVPSAFVVLEKLPLTPNGKVDRNALPAPVLSMERRGSTAPRNQTEKMVAEVWSAVIGVENVGIDEDFFQLGGHSLLAMRVVSWLRSASGTEIPLRMFFENATVAAIAEYIEGARLTAVEPSAAPRIEREEVVI